MARVPPGVPVGILAILPSRSDLINLLDLVGDAAVLVDGGAEDEVGRLQLDLDVA